MVNTRPKNAASHPGQVVLDADADGKKKRRSPEASKLLRSWKTRLMLWRVQSVLMLLI